jgi:hypothetical protein
MTALITLAAETEVFRGDGIEHDRSTPGSVPIVYGDPRKWAVINVTRVAFDD